jgi:hypothetical protein
MIKALRRTIAVVLATVACAASAAAQTDTRVPAGAVFGTTRTTTPGQVLNVTVNLAEAFDQDVVADIGTADRSLFAGSGFYTTVTPQLVFGTSGDRLRFGFNAASDARYYADLHKLYTTAHSAGIGLIAQLTPSASMSLNQAVTYSPALFSGLFAGGATAGLGSVLPSESSYLLESNPSYGYATTANFTQKLSERGSIAFDASFRYNDFTGSNPGYADVRSEDVGSRYQYAVSRGLNLRVGYSFRRGQYIGSLVSTEHNIDVGIGYSRPLSRTRKTTFGFGLGPTLASAPLPSGSSQDVRQQYRVVADLVLTHQMGRTWSVQGAYHRGLGYIEGFQSPVYTAGYATTAGGFLNRRTDVSLSAAYSTGESLTGSSSPFNTYSGNARLRFALGRMLATYVEYVFYDYQFNHSIQLPPGIPPALTRNGVRTGLTLWIPVRSR